MLVWSIWTQENQIRLLQPCCSTHQIAQVSKDRLGEFQAIQPTPKRQVQQSRVLGKPPPSKDLFKINFDGAIFSKANKFGIGVVIWNNQGLVLASLSLQLLQAYCPLEVEALAVAKAL